LRSELTAVGSDKYPFSESNSGSVVGSKRSRKFRRKPLPVASAHKSAKEYDCRSVVSDIKEGAQRDCGLMNAVLNSDRIIRRRSSRYMDRWRTVSGCCRSRHNLRKRFVDGETFRLSEQVALQEIATH
jgi:hypothetical protein